MPDQGQWSSPGGKDAAEPANETFEAIVLDWDGLGVADRQADLPGLRERIEELGAAGTHVVIVTGGPVGAVDEQLQARPHGRGRVHLCRDQGAEALAVTANGTQLVTGHPPVPPASDGAARVADVASVDTPSAAGGTDLRIHGGTDAVELERGGSSDSVHWAAGWLAGLGITGGLVLVCSGDHGTGDGRTGLMSRLVDAFPRAMVVSIGTAAVGTPEGTVYLERGPTRLIQLLDDQLARRASLRVPNIDLDPTWVVPLPVGHHLERIAEALGTLANGSVGVRASPEEEGRGTARLFLVNGVYTRDAHLLPGPSWTAIERPGVHARHAPRRLLDLRGGTLVRMDAGADGVRSMRFVSVASPHAMAIRAEASEPHLQSGEALRPPREVVEFDRIRHGSAVAASTGQAEAQIGVAARDHTVTAGGRRVIERLAAWVAAPSGPVNLDDAIERLAQVESMGFDALLAEHRSAWVQRWEDAGVVIEGDPEAELAARFAVFHLLNAAADTGETAVGARGLTGSAYGGHVFWDADIFVLPALAFLRPAAARAMLEYRIRRLPAARAAAAARDLAGARFPWESARDGRDVTPTAARGHHHELIPIRTGAHEEHIVADVAWAAAHYSTWTGDSSFLVGAGRSLLIETARYWASRIRTDANGHGHIDKVMGPDEYHQIVDDNAYTNVMARWNLRRGAELLEPGDGDDPAIWRGLADRLVDGWSPERGIYEQFAGYFDLEPLVIAQVAPPPVAADVLLGAARVTGSQLIKQPDVLMLHHLVPEEVGRSLAACLDFYGPRTAHGSSLSPAIHASLLARAGEPEQALELFRTAARLDLDDLTGTTAEGLHLATMGGVWQALAFGFMGLQAVAGGTLAIDPCLPNAWKALGLTFRFGGQRVGIRAERNRVTITCPELLRIRVADQAPRWCQPGSTIVANRSTTSRGRS